MGRMDYRLPRQAEQGGDLESPFLDHEFDTTEGEEERGINLGALEAESPFLQLQELAPQTLAFEEEIIGKDDRVRVADTFQVPNRWICAIDILIDNPRWGKGTDQPQFITKSRATGILIGPRYVLTAAHILDKQTVEVDGAQKSVAVKGFTVSPARNGNNDKNPFGKIKSKAVKVSQPYNVRRRVRVDGRDVEIPIRQHDDYALIILEQDVDAGTHSGMKGTLGYWGQDPSVAVIRRLDPTAVQGKTVTVAGYPGDTCGNDRLDGTKEEKEKKIGYCWNRRNDEWASTQWRGDGTLDVDSNTTITTLYHTADTYEGQSGAPLYLTLDRKFHLVGIHTGSDTPQRNQGVRITRQMLKELSDWINADAGSAIATVKNDTLIVQPKQGAATGATGSREFEFDEREFEAESGDELEEHEFRLDRLPATARQQFDKGQAFWRAAVDEAVRGGFKDANGLADIIFFMHHPERMAAGTGRLIDRREPDVDNLRAEWNEYRHLVDGLLSNPTCGVFLPANPSANYEDYVAAPTTGRMTLMINGRDSGGKGPSTDYAETFDSMQQTVESLGAKDSIFLAAWQFDPTVPLTAASATGVKTWGELFQRKAQDGVTIRIIMSDFDPIVPFLRDPLYKTFLPTIDGLIAKLPAQAQDNWKYFISRQPVTYPVVGTHVAVQHQKFMVVKTAGGTTAFCGGLDISFKRTPAYWQDPNFTFYPWLWHDIHSRLEGRITRDLESEFIRRWNREKDTQAVARSKHKSALEELRQSPAAPADESDDRNAHKVQMLRTVSVDGSGTDFWRIRRDDIWQGYLKLIGCATRFLYMENQYFREPPMADAIVKQVKAHPKLVVIIVAPYQLDDLDDAVKLHGNWLQHEFFRRLIAGVPAARLRTYTMFNRIIHAKLVLADDRALTIGSANANPRGFFLDTELNVMLDDPETVTRFRDRLWAHNLGVPQNTVAGWAVTEFTARWDAVAKANLRLTKTPDDMTGEGVIPFEALREKGQKVIYMNDVLT